MRSSCSAVRLYLAEKTPIVKKNANNIISLEIF